MAEKPDVSVMIAALKLREDETMELRARWTAALQLVRAKAEKWKAMDDWDDCWHAKTKAAVLCQILQELEQLEK